MTSLKEGDKAPFVKGINQDGKEITSEDFKGKKLVLYFYPKDNTSGCTAEACSLNDNYDTLTAQGYEVVGISPDSAGSHQKFIAKYNFCLLYTSTYDGELDFAFPPQAITVTLEDEIDISRGEMLVHPDNLPIISRNFEAMLVWMDEKKMDPEEQFFIKHTTNLTRAKIDKIRYKVNVNTLEQSAADALELNEIARVIFTTGKPLFFDPYSQNKNTGAFILIDPITNNTCAVGMIIDKVERKDMQELEIPEINLSKLGIGSEHFTAIEKVAKELDRQGITVKIIQ